LYYAVPAQITEIIPDKLTVTAGGTATFKCATSGDPSPAVRWLRVTDTVSVSDDGRLSLVEVSATDNTDERVFVDGGILTIQNATLDDQGTYVCEAGNKVGKTQRQNVTLDVLGK